LNSKTKAQMATKNNELEMFSFDQIKDEFIGKLEQKKELITNKNYNLKYWVK
jgi:hypothetical protein